MGKPFDLRVKKSRHTATSASKESIYWTVQCFDPKVFVTQKLKSYFLPDHRFPVKQERLPQLQPQWTEISGYKPDPSQKTACRHQVSWMSRAVKSAELWAFIYTFILRGNEPASERALCARPAPETRQTISLTIASLFPCFWDFLSWSRWQDKQRELFIPAVSCSQWEEQTQSWVLFCTSVAFSPWSPASQGFSHQNVHFHYHFFLSEFCKVKS